MVTQNSDNAIESWEVQEAKSLLIQSQLNIRDKQTETSTWVEQNMLRIGKLLGADFQGHEQEVLELLLQVDSYRMVRRSEVEVKYKKARLRGAQELKNLVAFDVKFKSGGERGKGRNNQHNSKCIAN